MPESHTTRPGPHTKILSTQRSHTRAARNHYNQGKGESEMEPLITAAEAARYLRVRPWTVYAWARSGRLNSVRIGRLVDFVGPIW